MKSESKIQNEILNWLASKQIFCWRQNSGSIKGIYKGKERLFKFIRFIYPSPKKVKMRPSDIAGICNGCFFAIEVKSPGKKPSKEQENYLKWIKKSRNGIGFCASSLDEVKKHFSKRFRI